MLFKREKKKTRETGKKEKRKQSGSGIILWIKRHEFEL